MMRKQIKILCLGLCALLSLGMFSTPSQAQVPSDPELVRERALAFEIFGINARMSTEEIIKTLEAQGFKPTHSNIMGRSARFENDKRQSFDLVAPHHKNLADTPWETIKMESAYNGIYLPVCNAMIKEYNTLCAGLITDTGPCYLRDVGESEKLMLAKLHSRNKKSSDGYVYSIEARVQPQQYCTYNIRRRTR